MCPYNIILPSLYTPGCNMFSEDLDDFMNTEIRKALRIIPEFVIWRNNAFDIFTRMMSLDFLESAVPRGKNCSR